jgi:hypothetical protein
MEYVFFFVALWGVLFLLLTAVRGSSEDREMRKRWMKAFPPKVG